MRPRKNYRHEKSLVTFHLLIVEEELQILFSPYAGDMLELWAVDLPELYHLNDVIVFSVRGERECFFPLCFIYMSK